jgi:hypothetical protein
MYSGLQLKKAVSFAITEWVSGMPTVAMENMISNIKNGNQKIRHFLLVGVSMMSSSSLI